MKAENHTPPRNCPQYRDQNRPNLSPGGRDEAVAGAPLRLDVTGVLSVVAQLLPQPADEELEVVEGLGQVAVGAQVERLHLVEGGVARGEHQDRHPRALADPPADLEAV